MWDLSPFTDDDLPQQSHDIDHAISEDYLHNDARFGRISSISSKGRDLVSQFDFSVFKPVMVDTLWLHFPLILITNIFVISVTFLVKRLHTPNNILIGGLAMIDLLTGLIDLPILWLTAPYEFRGDSHPNNIEIFLQGSKGACIFTSFVNVVFREASLNFILLVSIERFIAITFPFKYAQYSSNQNAVLAMILVFFLTILQHGIAISFPQIDWQDGLSEMENVIQCTLANLYSKTYVTLIRHNLTIIKLITSISLTLWVGQRARKMRRDHPGRLSCYINMKKHLSNYRTNLALNSIYLVLWIPPVAFQITNYVDKTTNKMTLYWLKGVYVHCVFINAWINAFIYAISKPSCRRAYCFLIKNSPCKWSKVDEIFRDEINYTQCAMYTRRFAIYTQSKLQDSQPTSDVPQIKAARIISGCNVDGPIFCET